MKLTVKREKFVLEVVAGKSQREAYRIAYPTSREWKDAHVDSAASNLMKDIKVSARYNELMGKVVAAAEEKCIMTATEILETLSNIARADIKDFLEFKTAKTVVEKDAETGENIIDYATIINLKDSCDVDGKLIQEVSLSNQGKLTFKLHDKMAALDKLGKHLKLFTDKVELTGKDGNAIQVQGMSTDDIDKRIADLQNLLKQS